MINYIALAVALILSSVSAYYSIIGLTAIFTGAFIPIVVMGCSLEAAKVVATSWVYRNWHTAPITIKYYLITAIVILMLITSMGTFGYLSKAHLDKSVPLGDVSAKLSLYDEKIRVSSENIQTNRKAIKQLDEAVDQVMARSSDEKGADKAVALRRSQQKERARLFNEIEAEQKKISDLNEQRAPIAAEARKVESEVGPLKYIAELIYDSSDPNILDRAVRFVIMLIVVVFDPLAVVLLIAANHGLYGKRSIPKPTDDTTWIDRVKSLKFKRDPNKIEVDPDSIMKL